MKYTVIQKSQKGLTIKQQPFVIMYHYVNTLTIPPAHKGHFTTVTYYIGNEIEKVLL